MKNQKAWVVLAVAAGAVALSGTVWAATNTKDITVTYGIDVAVDGVVAQFEDSNGNTVYPFVYEGTTYVPIRGAAESVGATVDYDADLNMAVITSGSTETDSDINSALDYLTCMNHFNSIQIYGDALTNIDDTASRVFLYIGCYDYSVYESDINSMSGWVVDVRDMLTEENERLLAQKELMVGKDQYDTILLALEYVDTLLEATDDLEDAIGNLNLYAKYGIQTYYEVFYENRVTASEATWDVLSGASYQYYLNYYTARGALSS